jgi:hypothetical protein
MNRMAKDHQSRRPAMAYAFDLGRRRVAPLTVGKRKPENGKSRCLKVTWVTAVRADMP